MGKRKFNLVGFNAEASINKMMSILGVEHQGDLAEYLGASSQSLSNFKNLEKNPSGNISTDYIYAFTLKRGIPFEDFIKDLSIKPTSDISPKPDKIGRIDEPELDHARELPGLVPGPPWIEKRKYLKLRKMVDAITRSEITNEAMPELILAGLPNVTSFIIRQKYLDTHGLYF